MLGLSGDLEIKLSSPWWSPAPNKTWTWPLFSLEWPIGSGIGIGADIDYVIGSDKLPDVTLGKVDFDASKFMDSALDNELPQKSGGGDDKEKAGTWKGKDPPPPTTPPVAPTKGPAPPGGKAPTAGTPSGKAGKGKQTHDEAANVPKSPDAAKRWSDGLQELAAIHEHAEKAPEDDHEIHAQLDHLKKTYGFTEARATAQGDEWLIDLAMNPRARRQVRKLVSDTGKKLPGPRAGEDGTAYAARIGYPPAETNYHWAIVPPKLAYKRNPGMENSIPEKILNTGKRPPNFIKWEKGDPSETEENAAYGEKRMHSYMSRSNGFDLISERGKSPFATGIDGVYEKGAGSRRKYVIGEAKFGSARLKKPGSIRLSAR